jgi:hypothetical protein
MARRRRRIMLDTGVVLEDARDECDGAVRGRVLFFIKTNTIRNPD